ncbi:MAG: PLP-dependent aminotransferase family protein [Lautropia sp.]
MTDARPNAADRDPAQAPADPVDYPIAAGYRDIGESLIRELSKLMSRPGMISLAGGYPGPELFDREGLEAASSAALRDAPIACLQYGPTEGLLPVREAVVRVMASRGTACTPDDVLMTAGSQQGFDLLVRTLMTTGTSAVLERPTYTGPLRTLGVAGVRITTVGLDDDGLDVDELEALLRDPARPCPRLLYTVPTFANPSGSTMTLARRLKLLALAAEFHVLVVEDDPYGQLRFRGDPVPHLYALADQVPGSRPWVVHLGSFSKIVAPGLRLGYMLAPQPIRRACLLAKQLDDLSNPGWLQMTVARYIESGRLDAHLPSIIDAYRAKAGAMQQAIASHLSPAMRFNIPDGGMFMWGRIVSGASARDLLPLAIDAGVTFVPGDIYYADRHDAATMRLSFSSPTPQAIGQGVERIGQALRALAR